MMCMISRDKFETGSVQAKCKPVLLFQYRVWKLITEELIVFLRKLLFAVCSVRAACLADPEGQAEFLCR